MASPQQRPQSQQSTPITTPNDASSSASSPRSLPASPLSSLFRFLNRSSGAGANGQGTTPTVGNSSRRRSGSFAASSMDGDVMPYPATPLTAPTAQEEMSSRSPTDHMHAGGADHHAANGPVPKLFRSKSLNSGTEALERSVAGGPVPFRLPEPVLTTDADGQTHEGSRRWNMWRKEHDQQQASKQEPPLRSANTRFLEMLSKSDSFFGGD